jgi:hypothetical protein
MTQLVKFNRQLRSHDIQYSAVEDMLYLTTNNAMTLPDTGEELNHTLTTTFMGTTQQCIKRHSIQDMVVARSPSRKCNVFGCVDFGNEVEPTEKSNITCHSQEFALKAFVRPDERGHQKVILVLSRTISTTVVPYALEYCTWPRLIRQLGLLGSVITTQILIKVV